MKSAYRGAGVIPRKGVMGIHIPVRKKNSGAMEKMCNKRSSVIFKGSPRFRVDPCLRERIGELRGKGVETLES